jgi:lipid A oxidase
MTNHKHISKIVLTLCLGLLSSRGARAEFMVSVYGGVTFHQDGDLQFRQAGGTDLTFHDVSWKSRNFNSPPYYGARLAYFVGERSHWGCGVEFFHAKMYLDTARTVQVSGTRAGAAVNAQEAISGTIQDFNNSHGLNFLTADLIYRWFFAEPGQGFRSRIQPYTGIGAGVLIPHVEVAIGGVGQQGYQITGPGAQGFAGINWELARHCFVFTEYKFSYAHINGEDIPGGTISTELLTHHLVLGLGLRF